MPRNRFDETWHRLREWTKGQTPSERLSAQVLIHEGYRNLDPSHPLGGPDGGKDGVAEKDGRRFAMAVYFPRGQQDFKKIFEKFRNDLSGARGAIANGIAFVTNQELTLSERQALRDAGAPLAVDIYHLERVAMILDTPGMAAVRQQFLEISLNEPPTFDLGGKGGLSPGAGGGGGGAIGDGATGGPGGPGGNVRLDGAPGAAPGAGGGGAGAVGEGALGGEGGEGGEIVHALVKLDPKDAPHHFSVTVGKGGESGQPGGDSIVDIYNRHGDFLQRIFATGGRAGAAGFSGPRTTAINEESANSVRVTSVMAADVLHLREGLWNILAGGWDWITVSSVPTALTLTLLIEIDTGEAGPETHLDLMIIVKRPDGQMATQQQRRLQIEDVPVHRTRFAESLSFDCVQLGVWTVEIQLGTLTLRSFPIELRGRTEGPSKN